MNIKYFFYTIFFVSCNSMLANIFYAPNVGPYFNGTNVLYGDSDTGAIVGEVTDLAGGTFNAPAIIAVTPDGSKAYVTNSSGTTVSVIDVADNMVTQTVYDPSGTIQAPFGVAFTSDGSKAYVTNGNNSVSVIDVADNMVTQIVADGNFTDPSPVVFTPDGQYAYVLNDYSVSVIDVANNTVIGTNGGFVIDLTSTFSGPSGIAFTLDGQYAYVVNTYGDSVSIVNVLATANIAANTVIGTVADSNPPTFNAPSSIAITHDGSKAYVTNYGDGSGTTVSVIDIPENITESMVTGTVLNGNFLVPLTVILTPDGQYAYVVNAEGGLEQDGSISIVQVSNDTVISANSGVVIPDPSYPFNYPFYLTFVPNSLIPANISAFATRLIQKYGKA